MKVLLDECLPRRLKSLLIDFQVFTVQDMGWAGTVNGKLIKLAVEAGFTTFITIDKNLKYQNSISKLDISLIVIDTYQKTFKSIEPLNPELVDAIKLAKPGSVYTVSKNK